MASSSPAPADELLSGQAPRSANPILPGYYADPSSVLHEGKRYIYATLDPWGGETLGCWESADHKNWTYRVLNWPTKAACTSEASGGAAVWAPSVDRLPDGRFLMAISVGNEVWLGVADHPLGPWENTLGDKPFIVREYKPGYHMIDAEIFVDDDKAVYIYWGSGLEWKNGKCWVGRLSDDLKSFADEPKDVTPTHYFEGPHMVKRHGKYFLMYSDGITIKDTYQIHYAVGANPYGPFTEPSNSPILKTDKAINVVSPGHHSVFRQDGKDYILYHRHSIPFDSGFIGRQTCVDELKFSTEGTMEVVGPTHEGPPLVQGRDETKSLAIGSKVTASSERSPNRRAGFVTDANYATLWTPDASEKAAWLQINLGAERSFSRQIIRPEYAWKSYRFKVEVSGDGEQWETLADFGESAATGSPILIDKPATARFLRLAFPDDVEGKDVGIFEWAVME